MPLFVEYVAKNTARTNEDAAAVGPHCEGPVVPRPRPDDVTRLLEEAAQGREQAADQLLPLVYDQLKKIAQQRMVQERPGHTLQATALVHEAYLRLVGDEDPGWANRAHFFKAASEAMRRILIDYARKRGRIKRGGGQKNVAINVADLAQSQNLEEIVALDEAIQRLESQGPGMAEVVRLRFYVGLGIDETAQCLGVSRTTVKRDWSVARAWLHRQLRES